MLATLTNPGNPLDVNNDLALGPLDALTIINHLNRAASQQPAGSPSTESTRFLDVNEDGEVTPVDALSVLNALAAKRPFLALSLANDTSGNVDILPDGRTHDPAIIGAFPAQLSSLAVDIYWGEETQYLRTLLFTTSPFEIPADLLKSIIPEESTNTEEVFYIAAQLIDRPQDRVDLSIVYDNYGLTFSAEYWDQEDFRTILLTPSEVLQGNLSNQIANIEVDVVSDESIHVEKIELKDGQAYVRFQGRLPLGELSLAVNSIDTAGNTNSQDLIVNVLPSNFVKPVAEHGTPVSAEIPSANIGQLIELPIVSQQPLAGFCIDTVDGHGLLWVEPESIDWRKNTAIYKVPKNTVGGDILIDNWDNRLTLQIVPILDDLRLRDFTSSAIYILASGVSDGDFLIDGQGNRHELNGKFSNFDPGSQQFWIRSFKSFSALPPGPFRLESQTGISDQAFATGVSVKSIAETGTPADPNIASANPKQPIEIIGANFEIDEAILIGSETSRILAVSEDRTRAIVQVPEEVSGIVTVTKPGGDPNDPNIARLAIVPQLPAELSIRSTRLDEFGVTNSFQYQFVFDPTLPLDDTKWKTTVTSSYPRIENKTGTKTWVVIKTEGGISAPSQFASFSVEQSSIEQLRMIPGNDPRLFALGKNNTLSLYNAETGVIQLRTQLDFLPAESIIKELNVLPAGMSFAGQPTASDTIILLTQKGRQGTLFFISADSLEMIGSLNFESEGLWESVLAFPQENAFFAYERTEDAIHQISLEDGQSFEVNKLDRPYEGGSLSPADNGRDIVLSGAAGSWLFDRETHQVSYPYIIQDYDFGQSNESWIASLPYPNELRIAKRPLPMRVDAFEAVALAGHPANELLPSANIGQPILVRGQNLQNSISLTIDGYKPFLSVLWRSPDSSWGYYKIGAGFNDIATYVSEDKESPILSLQIVPVFSTASAYASFDSIELSFNQFAYQSELAIGWSQSSLETIQMVNNRPKIKLERNVEPPDQLRIQTSGGYSEVEWDNSLFFPVITGREIGLRQPFWLGIPNPDDPILAVPWQAAIDRPVELPGSYYYEITGKTSQDTSYTRSSRSSGELVFSDEVILGNIRLGNGADYSSDFYRAHDVLAASGDPRIAGSTILVSGRYIARINSVEIDGVPAQFEVLVTNSNSQLDVIRVIVPQGVTDGIMNFISPAGTYYLQPKSGIQVIDAPFILPNATSAVGTPVVELPPQSEITVESPLQDLTSSHSRVARIQIEAVAGELITIVPIKGQQAFWKLETDSTSIDSHRVQISYRPLQIRAVEGSPVTLTVSCDESLDSIQFRVSRSTGVLYDPVPFVNNDRTSVTAERGDVILRNHPTANDGQTVWIPSEYLESDKLAYFDVYSWYQGELKVLTTPVLKETDSQEVDAVSRFTVDGLSNGLYFKPGDSVATLLPLMPEVKSVFNYPYLTDDLNSIIYYVTGFLGDFDSFLWDDTEFIGKKTGRYRWENRTLYLETPGELPAGPVILTNFVGTKQSVLPSLVSVAINGFGIDLAKKDPIVVSEGDEIVVKRNSPVHSATVFVIPSKLAAYRLETVAIENDRKTITYRIPESADSGTLFLGFEDEAQIPIKVTKPGIKFEDSSITLASNSPRSIYVKHTNNMHAESARSISFGDSPALPLKHSDIFLNAPVVFQSTILAPGKVTIHADDGQYEFERSSFSVLGLPVDFESTQASTQAAIPGQYITLAAEDIQIGDIFWIDSTYFNGITTNIVRELFIIEQPGPLQVPLNYGVNSATIYRLGSSHTVDLEFAPPYDNDVGFSPHILPNPGTFASYRIGDTALLASDYRVSMSYYLSVHMQRTVATLPEGFLPIQLEYPEGLVKKFDHQIWLPPMLGEITATPDPTGEFIAFASTEQIRLYKMDGSELLQNIFFYTNITDIPNVSIFSEDTDVLGFTVTAGSMAVHHPGTAEVFIYSRESTYPVHQFSIPSVTEASFVAFVDGEFLVSHPGMDGTDEITMFEAETLDVRTSYTMQKGALIKGIDYENQTLITLSYTKNPRAVELAFSDLNTGDISARIAPLTSSHTYLYSNSTWYLDDVDLLWGANSIWVDRSGVSYSGHLSSARRHETSITTGHGYSVTDILAPRVSAVGSPTAMPGEWVTLRLEGNNLFWGDRPMVTEISNDGVRSKTRLLYHTTFDRQLGIVQIQIPSDTAVGTLEIDFGGAIRGLVTIVDPTT